MEETKSRQETTFEMLRKYGTRWAVLTAMRVDAANKGIEIPTDLDDELRYLRVKIGSGCFSTCEVGCSLNKLEGQLISKCSSLGESYVKDWSNLSARAMQGQIDPNHIAEIPALAPVKNDCAFLQCAC